jgi:hypothetical protein
MRLSLRSALACSAASTLLIALSACTSGDVPVGATTKSGQELQKKADGSATGDGSTCSWQGTAGYTGTSGQSAYAVGATFNSLDGCNECSCTAQGIACTLRACAAPTGCPRDAMICPDGSSVGRTGPNCSFAPCGLSAPGGGTGGGTACTAEAKKCPDGSYAARTGPSCEFAACPGGGSPGDIHGIAPCAKEECGPALGMPNSICPDGVTVAGPVCQRTNGTCSYTVVACPPSTGTACSSEAKQCPDGSFVSRTGPNCEFAPCPA